MAIVLRPVKSTRDIDKQNGNFSFLAEFLSSFGMLRRDDARVQKRLRQVHSWPQLTSQAYISWCANSPEGVRFQFP
jgi:hypothetical protein